MENQEEGHMSEEQQHSEFFTRASAAGINGKGKIVNEEEDGDTDSSVTEAPDLQQKENHPDKEICGICLNGTENEKGRLDCCKHTFCLQCIMMWGRKETSCPICKQRFLTITVTRTSVPDTPRTQKTYFCLPQRDLLDDHSSKRSFQLEIAKVETENLSLYVQDADYEDRSLFIRLESICRGCHVIFSDETLKVNGGQTLCLPLNDWPWFCEKCSHSCSEVDSPEVTRYDVDYELEVKGLPLHTSEGPSPTLGLRTLITTSSSEPSCSSPHLLEAAVSVPQTASTEDDVGSTASPEHDREHKVHERQKSL